MVVAAGCCTRKGGGKLRSLCVADEIKSVNPPDQPAIWATCSTLSILWGRSRRGGLHLQLREHDDVCWHHTRSAKANTADSLHASTHAPNRLLGEERSAFHGPTAKHALSAPQREEKKAVLPLSSESK